MKQLVVNSFSILGLILICVSCGDKVDVEAPVEQALIVEEIRITQKDIDSLDYVDYALDPEIQQAISQWNGFQELASSVDYLKTADLTFFKSDIQEVKDAIQKCEFNVTKPFFTDAIMARLVVVETKFLKLQNDLTLDNIPKNEQLASIKEVFIAWSNFIYIINKKFEFEANDVSRPE